MDHLGALCPVIDVGIRGMLDVLHPAARRDGETWSGSAYVLPAGVLVLSLFFLLTGAAVARPSIVISATLATFVAAYAVLMQPDGLACTVRFTCSAVLSLLAAVLSACTLRIGLFLFGATCVAGSIHLLFVGAPVLDALTPRVGPRSIAYYAVMCVGGLLGGFFVRMYDRPTMEILTSTAGGAGCAYATRAFVVFAAGDAVPAPVYLCAGVAFAAGGVLFQRRRRLHRRVNVP